jgi:hypothetical protein
MAIVIVKNNTGSPVNIEDLGTTLTASEIRDFTTFFDFVDLIESDDLKALVSAATVTINDGTNDLGVSKGLEHLEIESVHEDYIQDEDDGVALAALPYCGAVTNQTTILTDVWSDTIYELVELQNYPDVLEWLVSTPERITVKEDGLYRIFTSNYIRANGTTTNSYFRVSRNGIQISNEANLFTGDLEKQQSVIDFSIYLYTGDYITSQTRCNTGKNIDLMQSQLQVQRIDGIKGDPGPPGGTTLVVQDEGSPITVNTATLNFVGASVLVSDGGNNKANISLVDTSHVTKYVQLFDTAGGVQLNTTLPTFLPWDGQDYRDTDSFNHSTITNTSRVYVIVTGWYVLSYAVNFLGDNGVKNIAIYARANGTLDIPRTTSYGNSFRNGDPYGSTTMSGVMIPLNAGDYLEIGAYKVGSSGVCYTIADQSWLSMRYTKEM